MNLEKKYPIAYRFLAGYFPDADLDGISDEDVVANYLADYNKSEKFKPELDQCKAELRDLIHNIENYWEEVGLEANRYFATSADALEWLNMINTEIQK